MRFLSLLFSALLVLLPAALQSELKMPADPKIPDFKDLKTPEGDFIFPVTLHFASGKTGEGELILGFSRATFTYRRENKWLDRVDYLINVKTIEFVKWKGSTSDGRFYSFRPSVLKVSFNDGAMFSPVLPDRKFDRMVFRSSGKNRYVYTFFNDYWKEGKWFNSGEQDRAYPEIHPHPDTVVKIEFR